MTASFLPTLGRRRLLKTVAAGSVGLIAPHFGRLHAETDSAEALRLRPAPAEASMVGNDGLRTRVWAYNGVVPGPTLRVPQGALLRAAVENGLAEGTTVHWHGIRLPNAMDGVPGLTQATIPPGGRFDYTFAPPDAALLGGLVLNLMPCVLPVLSLKLLALLGHTGTERRIARLGLFATAAGIVTSFGVLAAALIALKATGAAIGWGIQFQQPWFLAVMALVTTLFAASFWDWLPFALPGSIAGTVGSVRGRGRISDAFLLGAFATLLAASCSAPFVLTALGFALARGPLDIALVFGAMGFGMAAPFLAVAAAPVLVAWVPRPGPWMGWIRRVLGLALLGTAAWLLSVLALEAGSDAALIAGAALAILLAALASRQHIPFGRHAAGIAAIVLAAVAVLIPAFHGQAVPSAPPAPNADAGLWRPFDEAALHRLVVEQKIVFVDVSAAWCLTCKVNELTVLDRAPVADRLRARGVVAMRADWTRPDPIITAYLTAFGRYGVPLNVVYGPGAPEGIALSELLTQTAVMDAFRRAGAARAEAAE